MPSKIKSKSIDNLNRRLARYELMALYTYEHIKGILRYAWSPSLVEDFEFIVMVMTLLNLNLVPREIRRVKALYRRYSQVNLTEF